MKLQRREISYRFRKRRRKEPHKVGITLESCVQTLSQCRVQHARDVIVRRQSVARRARRQRLELWMDEEVFRQITVMMRGWNRREPEFRAGFVQCCECGIEGLDKQQPAADPHQRYDIVESQLRILRRKKIDEDALADQQI